tara:strand:- start:2229 stop:3260 length:1032 start_codon:yes stop_codon:yes gene_type:complete
MSGMESQQMGANRAATFAHVIPAGRRATQYEEVTLHMQWSPDNFATQGWFNLDKNGSPPWKSNSTLLTAQDWWAYRDPAAEWYRPFIDRQLIVGHAIKHSTGGAKNTGAFALIDPGWLGFLATHYAAYRFVEYGLFLALCQAQRECASDVIAQPIIFQSLEKDRHAQDIALHCMEIETCVPGFTDADCKTLWLTAPAWQPMRKLIELLLAARDWGEIHLVVNLLVDGIIAPLFMRELVLGAVARHGDVVTSAIVLGAEADRSMRQKGTGALVSFLLEQDTANRAVIEAWLARWMPLVRDAALALGPIFEDAGADFAAALAIVAADHRKMMDDLLLVADAGLVP